MNLVFFFFFFVAVTINSTTHDHRTKRYLEIDKFREKNKKSRNLIIVINEPKKKKRYVKRKNYHKLYRGYGK